jgi:thiamine-phosphate pyrophosphorylase
VRAASDRRARLAAARLYLVCPAAFEPRLDAALNGGVDIVQLRDKELADADLLAAAARFREACHSRDVLFILNDRPDLAAAANADGVHVGQGDAPIDVARREVGPDRLVGLSTHTPAQVDAASGVDYIGVGPVHATPTKPGRPRAGLSLVGYASSHAAVPFFAIGGIDARNAELVAGAGAERFAVVRAIVEAADPEAAARQLRAALEVRVGAP